MWQSWNVIMQHWIALLLHRDQLVWSQRDRCWTWVTYSSLLWLCCWKDELKSRQAAVCWRQRNHELCLEEMIPAASHKSTKKLLFLHYWSEIQKKMFCTTKCWIGWLWLVWAECSLSHEMISLTITTIIIRPADIQVLLIPIYTGNDFFFSNCGCIWGSAFKVTVDPTKDVVY